MFRYERCAFVEAEAFEDIGVAFDDLFTGEAHLFVGVGVVALEGEGFLHGLVHDDFESGFIGVAELLIEGVQDKFRALDQVIVVENQVSGGGMRVEILKRVTVPVSRHVEDFIQIQPGLFGVGKLTSRIVNPRDGGGEHIERIASEVYDAGFGEEFDERFDLGAEGGILGDIIFFAGGIHVTLYHGFVERHDAAFVFGGEGFVEVQVIWIFIHEREEKGDEETVPDVEVDVFVLFGLEEGDGMDFEFAEGCAVEGVQGAMENPAKEFVVKPCKELGDLLLCDGGGEVNVPGGEAGECFSITREQTMEKGGTAPQVA